MTAKQRLNQWDIFNEIVGCSTTKHPLHTKLLFMTATSAPTICFAKMD
jgi:hypothetical protein